MSKKRKQRMKASDALDLVPDDVGDGAAFAMAADMTGMDYADFIEELVDEAEAQGRTKRN